MSHIRMGRINEEMQRTLAEALRGVKDPRVQGLLTVTAVETSPDLKYAKVFVSVLEGNDASVFRGLKSASGYLRRVLGETLSLRTVPELTFYPDDSMQKGARVLEIMGKMEEMGEKGENQPIQKIQKQES